MATRTMDSPDTRADDDRPPQRPSPLAHFLWALIVIPVVHLAFAQFVPTQFIPSLLEAPSPVPVILRALGLLPFLGGLALMLWADAQFRRARTTIKPFGTPSRLVTHGAFAFSRHPMYAGMTAMLAGLSLLLASPAALAVTAIFAWRLRQTFMLPEEWRLASQFGAAWREYAQQVGRWVSLPLG